MRAGGLEAGERSLQVVPFQVHVSFRGVVPLPSPPKRTTVPVAGSKAIDASKRADGLTAGDRWVQVVAEVRAAEGDAEDKPDTAFVVSKAATAATIRTLVRLSAIPFPFARTQRNGTSWSKHNMGLTDASYFSLRRCSRPSWQSPVYVPLATKGR